MPRPGQSIFLLSKIPFLDIQHRGSPAQVPKICESKLNPPVHLRKKQQTEGKVDAPNFYLFPHWNALKSLADYSILTLGFSHCFV